MEVALPNELTREQNLELVNDFVKKEIGLKPYQYCLHMPNAALGDVDQNHFHVMYSDRLPDSITRPPEQHFRRYNAKTPEKGGCKKDSGGKDPATLKSEVVRRRESWANLQNERLEKFGHSARVDHRSNRDRGIAAEPERHLGQAGVRKLSADEVMAIKAKRQK
jgi:hypothetical protein